MFDLWRLEREHKKLEKKFRPLLAQAKKQKNADKYEVLLYEWLSEKELIEDALNSLTTWKLIRKASKLNLPIPPHSDGEMWQPSPATRLPHLSAKGRNELRALIRTERRARYAEWATWIPLLIGLIGAVTGLLAVLLSLL